MSILHLRSTSEPWETSPTSAFPPSGSGSSRSYSGVRGVVLTKHQSLGSGSNGSTNQARKEEGTFFSGSRINSQELFVSGMCSRELSPVRWCDQEVDGVYLGRSGWVQVQQRSLDENRRTSYNSSMKPTTSSLPQSRRPGIKLADYHCNSEPGKCPEVNRSLELQRPAYLPLKTRDIEYASTTPSPHSIPESFSPPPITPIISPPPAFQDRIKSRARTVYGKPPFLPRSDAIVDSDIISPPATPPPPPINWTTLPETRQGSGISLARKTKLTPSPVSGHSYRQHSRIPQTKSLEEATTNRRSQFVQRYKESSSSSSSSLGFRSLDSCVSRPVMPCLAEHGGSIDMYEDADEEDNNSSSLNLSNVSSMILNSSPDSVVERAGSREKTSPSSRSTRLVHHRSQSRRSPASSDANKQVTCSSPSSSSSSSSGFPVRSPSGSGAAFRRSTPIRQHTPVRNTAQDDQQRVRRSRSLQLPEKRSPGSVVNVQYREHVRVSPQQQIPQEPHRVVVKIANAGDRQRRQPVQSHSVNDELNDDMLREAEVVTEFLYGSRSRAAAKALLLHRFHDRREDIPKEVPKQPSNNGFNIYFVGNNKNQQRQKPLQRGATTPNMQPTSQSFTPSPTTESKNPCNSNTCDFWPHCAQRENLNNQAQNVYAGSMKVSPSYPTHQRSPQETIRSESRPGDSTPEPQKKRNGNMSNARTSSENKTSSFQRRPATPSDRAMSSDRDKSEVSDQYVRELSVGRRVTPGSNVISNRDVSVERKTSPVNPKSVSHSPSALGNSSCSSSSSDIWITTSDRTITKSPRNAKSSGASTPMDDHTMTSSTKSDPQTREMILTRPGSAPVNVEEERAQADITDSQKRSMSLPKSFLSGKNKHR